MPKLSQAEDTAMPCPYKHYPRRDTALPCPAISETRFLAQILVMMPKLSQKPGFLVISWGFRNRVFSPRSQAPAISSFPGSSHPLVPLVPWLCLGMPSWRLCLLYPHVLYPRSQAPSPRSQALPGNAFLEALPPVSSCTLSSFPGSKRSNMIWRQSL